MGISKKEYRFRILVCQRIIRHAFGFGTKGPTAVCVRFRIVFVVGAFAEIIHLDHCMLLVSKIGAALTKNHPNPNFLRQVMSISNQFGPFWEFGSASAFCSEISSTLMSESSPRSRQEQSEDKFDESSMVFIIRLKRPSAQLQPQQHYFQVAVAAVRRVFFVNAEVARVRPAPQRLDYPCEPHRAELSWGKSQLKAHPTLLRCGPQAQGILVSLTEGRRSDHAVRPAGSRH